jgi:5-oxoprolinase (ATP-hydrolysing) subunit A
MAGGVRIDLNADVGESFGAWTMGADAELLTLVTSANVACGFHAGDPSVMDLTVGLAARAGVALGAHPGHPDLRGFGRRVLHAAPDEIERDVLYQVGALQAFARAHGTRVVHVKPHGALYNQAADDPVVARAVARGVARAGKDLVLVGLASTEAMRAAAGAEGIRFAAEAFADRRYTPAGTLQSRREPGAVLTDPAAAAAQAVRIATTGRVTAIDGSEIALQAETLCLHGDNPAAIANATAVRRALEAAGVAVQSLIA